MNSKKNSDTHQVGWIQHVLVQEDNSNEEAWVYGWVDDENRQQEDYGLIMSNKTGRYRRVVIVVVTSGWPLRVSPPASLVCTYNNDC